MSDNPPPLRGKETNSVTGQQEQLTNALSDEASLGHMLKLAGPMVVVHISFTIMQFVDTRMVASLGTSEYSGQLRAGGNKNCQHIREPKPGPRGQSGLFQLLLAGDSHGVCVLSCLRGDTMAERAVDIQSRWAARGDYRPGGDLSPDNALHAVSSGAELVEQSVLHGYSSADYFDVRDAGGSGGEYHGQLRADIRQVGTAGDGHRRSRLGDVHRRGCQCLNEYVYVSDGRHQPDIQVTSESAD